MKFNGALKLNEQFDTACTSHLRRQVEARLNTAQKKLSSADVFQAAAKPKNGDDMVSMFGTMLLMGFLLHGAEEMIGNCLGINMDFMPAGTIATAAEFGAELRDTATEGRFKNKVEGYPEGRRKDVFGGKKPSKQFNLVCGNDQSRFDMDTEQEVRAMMDLLEAIQTVEKKGTNELNIEHGQTVKQALYAAIRQPTAVVRRDMFKSLSLAA